MSAPVVPVIKKILDYRTSGTVIDIGTGFGHHALFLAEHGFTVTATDTNEKSISALQQAAEEKGLAIDARVGDVRDAAALGKTWDIVICTFVLHFLKDDEIEGAINVLKHITNPGGLNVVAVHTVENVTERDRKPHLFEPEELKQRYADWGILYYWQGLGTPFVSKRTGERLEKYRADLIAQKI